MNYVIMKKALRKVFVTIKGFYFQAEIEGQQVTWLMAHKSGPVVINKSVDMPLVTYFVLFYTTLLGFINYKLYESLGITYPPRIKQSRGIIIII